MSLHGGQLRTAIVEWEILVWCTLVTQFGQSSAARAETLEGSSFSVPHSRRIPRDTQSHQLPSALVAE
eukprot:12885358-Prorocentrum_lima.AAC.1